MGLRIVLAGSVAPDTAAVRSGRVGGEHPARLGSHSKSYA